ncbi:MAG: glycosyltransferase family 4 protein [bacterium]|nr:glycosyltransferase family 4 protein [bacterium]
MKILMVSLDKGLLGGGQLGDVVARHCAYGEQPGVERLDIVVLSGRGYAPFALSPNVQAHPTNSISPWLYLTDGIRLAEGLFSQRQYDLVVTQDPFLTGLIGAHMKRRHASKLLVHFHGDFFDNRHWMADAVVNRFLLPFARSVVRQADGLRAVSQGIADKLVRFGIPRNRIRVIPTPVDASKFRSVAPEAVAQFRREHGIPNGAKVLLSVGRNDPAKDYPTLYAAVAAVCRRYGGTLHLVQLGAGLTSEDIAAKIAAPPARLTVSARARLPQDQLIAAYHAADVYVSSSRHESFGKVLIEANAAGVPLVATDTTGSKEIVRPGVNGYLAPVGNPEALAEKIAHLLEHPDLARAIGERGQALVAERFDGGSSLRAVTQFWRELTAPTP